MRAPLPMVICSIVTAAGCLGLGSFGEAGFPHGYLLYGKEIPAGLRLRPLDADDAQDGPMEKNPGPLKEEALTHEHGEGPPSAGWGEVFYPRGEEETDEVGIWALQWDSSASADRAAAALEEEECGDDTASLRDGAVLVVVWGDGEGSGQIAKIVAALTEKTGSLDKLC